ncbi:MAG: dTMP kinase [Firmicutes bacterium]|nr:dTMP kinase [Bacillota bacterium]
MKGVFITFEGPDASGKTTQIERLRSHLVSKNLDVLVTREPGGTPISEKIRNIILDKENSEMNPVTEALLYAASRAQHVAQVIEPALRTGKIVISDRFLDSSIAYQGYGRGLGDMVRIINEPAAAEVKPDLTFLLSGDPATLRSRRSLQEEDRMDSQQNDFHRTVMKGYINIAESEPGRVRIIDACGQAEVIAREIAEIADSVIDGRSGGL